ncbi:MAG TPA: methyltransferase [Bdellovibrionota bacterium]|nr:methyltransferase [Bdellovibrionota bacterium]
MRRAARVESLLQGLSIDHAAIKVAQKLLRLSSLVALRDFVSENPGLSTETARRARETVLAMAEPWKQLDRRTIEPFSPAFREAFLKGDAGALHRALSHLSEEWPALGSWLSSKGAIDWGTILSPRLRELRQVLDRYHEQFYEPYLRPVALAAGPRGPFWSRLSPEAADLFFTYCDLICFESNDRIVSKMAIAPGESVLDLGSGSQLLLSQLLGRIPVRAQSLDSVERPFEEPGIRNNVGSFLGNEDLDGRFDAVLMAWVLHDWPDAQAIAALKYAARHLAPRGRVLILEQLRPENGLKPDSTLDLLVHMHVGGQERTESHYRNLIEKAGLRIERIVENLGNRDLIEVRRRDP